MVEMVTCSLGEEQRLNSEVNLRSILKTRTTDDVTVIRCKGRIVWGIETAVLFDRVAELLPRTLQIVIDLSGVEIIDASGLGELVSVAVAAQASGCSIKLASPGDFIWRLLSVTNLTSVFEVFSTVDAAILAFSGEAATAYAEF